jgi:hypothetical protein
LLVWRDTWLVKEKSGSAWRWVLQFCQKLGIDSCIPVYQQTHCKTYTSASTVFASQVSKQWCHTHTLLSSTRATHLTPLDWITLKYSGWRVQTKNLTVMRFSVFSDHLYLFYMGLTYATLRAQSAINEHQGWWRTRNRKKRIWKTWIILRFWVLNNADLDNLYLRKFRLPRSTKFVTAFIWVQRIKINDLSN